MTTDQVIKESQGLTSKENDDEIDNALEESRRHQIRTDQARLDNQNYNDDEILNKDGMEDVE